MADYDLGTERWDAIVSIWCHLPPTLRADVHQRVVRALRPGGIFIVEAYTPRQLEYKTGGPPVAEMMMSAEILRHELSGVEFLHLVECDREVREGRGHHGPSAVVQCIARKIT